MLIALRLGRYFAVNLEARKLRPPRRATMLSRPNEGKGQEKKQRSQICYQGRRVGQMCGGSGSSQFFRKSSVP